jgi:hypothetical protein
MKKIAASVVLITALVAVVAAPASAGGCAAVGVALGLASFAVFNQLVFGLFAPAVYASTTYYAPYPAYYHRPAVYASAPVVYAAAPAVAAPRPAPSAAMTPTEVVYAHGRYVLRGDGVTVPYQWVWIANAAPAVPVAPTLATR